MRAENDTLRDRVVDLTAQLAAAREQERLLQACRETLDAERARHATQLAEANAALVRRCSAMHA